MDHSKATLLVALLLAAGTVAFGNTDLKRILLDAAQKYAWDQNTSIDRFMLAEGFCFSPQDESRGEQDCQNQPANMHWLDYGDASITRSYITRRIHRPQNHELETQLEAAWSIDDFNISSFETVVTLTEKALFTKNISIQVDLKVLDEADPPLVFARNGSFTISTADDSHHKTKTETLTTPPEHPTIRTGCLLRNYRVVEIDTDFILEFIIPVHGSIVVAFKDPISLPWQEGTHKIGALPVDLLLKIAKGMNNALSFEVPDIGFPSYHGAIRVMDTGANEELRFGACKGKEREMNAPVAPSTV